MAKRPLWLVQVAEKKSIAQDLVAVRLQAEVLREFPRDCEGDYIKLLLPKSADVSIHQVNFAEPDLSGLYKRSFTVERVEDDAIVIWMTTHDGEHGPAARWLNTAQLGDEVLVTGPGPVQTVDVSAAHFLFVADLPGFAGMVANLRRLPASARGHVFVEVPAPEALPVLELPEHMQLHALITEPERTHGEALLDAVRGAPWPVERCFIWAACEYGVMKGLRSYFFEQRAVSRGDIYLSSYWKLGDSDEQHKKTKHEEFPED